LSKKYGLQKHLFGLASWLSRARGATIEIRFD
jgi:hypothetical protein